MDYWCALWFWPIEQAHLLPTRDEFIARALGGNDPVKRIADLDDEGVWGEVIYPSLGIWAFNIRTPEVARVGAQALNEFALDFQGHSPRFGN